MNEPDPEVQPDTRPQGGGSYAAFLDAVLDMVNGEAPTDATAGPGAEGTALDKSTRRHEERLAKAERRSARKRRKTEPVAAPEAAPSSDQSPRTFEQSPTQRVPTQATEPSVDVAPDVDPAAVLTRAHVAASRRVRRRESRRETAVRAVSAPHSEDEPVLEVAVVEGAVSVHQPPARRTRGARGGTGRGEGPRPDSAGPGDAPPTSPEGPARREAYDGGQTPPDSRPAPEERARRREQRVLARARRREEKFLARADRLLAAGRLREERAQQRQAATGPESLEGGTASRRRVKVSAAVVAVVVAAALPWVVPRLPDTLAGLVPGHHGASVHVKDPQVAPPSDAVVGPVGVDQQAGPYDGVRLESAGRPRRVQVDRLHVDSEVVPISGQSGSLLPPSDPQLLGWWQEGQPVGSQSGTAVITGHTVHTGGGALDHLDQLVVGDSIRVRTDAGWITYVVERTQVYSTARLARAASDLFRQDGIGRLVLITCDNWNGQFYESNALVIASPRLDQPRGS